MRVGVIVNTSTQCSVTIALLLSRVRVLGFEEPQKSAYVKDSAYMIAICDDFDDVEDFSKIPEYRIIPEGEYKVNIGMKSVIAGIGFEPVTDLSRIQTTHEPSAFIFDMLSEFAHIYK